MASKVAMALFAGFATKLNDFCVAISDRIQIPAEGIPSFCWPVTASIMAPFSAPANTILSWTPFLPCLYDDCHAVRSNCLGAIYVALHGASLSASGQQMLLTKTTRWRRRKWIKWPYFDAIKDVFTVTAHDHTLLPLIDIFPWSINA